MRFTDDPYSDEWGAHDSDFDKVECINCYKPTEPTKLFRGLCPTCAAEIDKAIVNLIKGFAQDWQVSMEEAEDIIWDKAEFECFDYSRKEGRNEK